MQSIRWSIVTLIVGLLVGLPAAGLAQTPARADLVGAWVWTQTSPGARGVTMVSKQFLALRDDSTWIWRSELNGKEEGQAAGRWAMAGDSLWLGDMAATDTVFDWPGNNYDYQYVGGRIVPKWPTLKVNLSAGKLSLTDYDRYQWNPKSPFEYYPVYSRSTDPMHDAP